MPSSDVTELIATLKEQLAIQEKLYQKQEQRLVQQEQMHKEQIDRLIGSLQSRGECTSSTTILTSDNKFSAFDPTTEL